MRERATGIVAVYANITKIIENLERRHRSAADPAERAELAERIRKQRERLSTYKTEIAGYIEQVTPATARKCVALNIYDGLKAEAVAQRLNLSPSTATKYIFNAHSTINSLAAESRTK